MIGPQGRSFRLLLISWKNAMTKTILISIALDMLFVTAYILYVLINAIANLFATMAVIIRRDRKGE